ncbi:MAG: hypothetical protein E7487_10205 [Ruminococcaceae bacterium]|nr:hypothetical protein [Oscillospiraceae bacterium]
MKSFFFTLIAAATLLLSTITAFADVVSLPVIILFEVMPFVLAGVLLIAVAVVLFFLIRKLSKNKKSQKEADSQ